MILSCSPKKTSTTRDFRLNSFTNKCYMLYLAFLFVVFSTMFRRFLLFTSEKFYILPLYFLLFHLVSKNYFRFYIVPL